MATMFPISKFLHAKSHQLTLAEKAELTTITQQSQKLNILLNIRKLRSEECTLNKSFGSRDFDAMSMHDLEIVS